MWEPMNPHRCRMNHACPPFLRMSSSDEAEGSEHLPPEEEGGDDQATEGEKGKRKRKRCQRGSKTTPAKRAKQFSDVMM